MSQGNRQYMLLEEQYSKQTWRLSPDQVYRLGRNEDQDILLEDSSISRAHAELFWNGQYWCLRDCGSTYGTFVGDQQITPHQTYPLHSSQTFRLGIEPGVTIKAQIGDVSPHDSSASQRSAKKQDLYVPTSPPQPPFSLSDFQGHSAIKQELKRYADLILDADLHHPLQGILLLAPEGRGKRFLCRCLADQLGQERGQSFQYMSRDLKDAKNLAQARKLIRGWFKECKKHTPIVFLLQNFEIFYQYFQQAESLQEIPTGQLTWWGNFTSFLGFVDPRSEAEKARKLLEQLKQDIDTVWQWNQQRDSKVLVLVSVKNPELLPPEFQDAGRIFSHVLRIPTPDVDGRRAVLTKYLYKTGVPLAKTVDLEQLIQQMGRMDGHEIQNFVKDADRHRYSLGSPYFRWIDFEPFLSASSDKVWEKLVLPNTILQQLQQLAKVLREVDLSVTQGPNVPRGLLLTGPPGTGKTEIARVLAKAAGNCDLEFVIPSRIKSPLVGQAVKNLSSIFARARAQAPFILFFDEIDALFPRRDEQSTDSTTLEIVNEFLQQTEGFNSSPGVFVLGATNRSDEVDPAVVSRLRDTLHIPLPNPQARQTLLEKFATQNGWQLAADIDLVDISRLLQGKSGRDIQAVLDRAVRAYSQRTNWEVKPGIPVILTRDDFESAILPTVHVDLSAWNDLILSPEIKDSIQAILQQFLGRYRNPLPGILPPKGMLLSGPPGVGKTLVAKVLARAAGCRFINLSIAEVRSKYVGDATKTLSQTFELARREAPVILFIDEIDALLPKREDVVLHHEVELVNQFLQELDGVEGGAPGVFVIGATNFIERVDEAVKSRLNKKIEIPLPHKTEIVQLLHLFTRDMTVDANIDWAAIAQLLQGKSGRDILQLVSEVGQYAADTLPPDTPWVVTTEHFRTVLQTKLPQGDLTWEDIILPETTKKELYRLVKLIANYANLPPGVSLPRGALLIGPPGTGKTLTAKVIASVARLYFKNYAPGNIRNKYVGQSAKNLANAFQQARQNSPAILFFDEIESLFPSRAEMGSTSADREDQNLVSQFLQEVDGAKLQAGYVFVLGATNYPDRVDPAVRSRLNREISMPLPEADARLQLLQASIHSEWQLADDVDLLAYANFLEGKSGRDINAGVQKVAELAFDDYCDDWKEGQPIKVCDRHFRQAFQIRLHHSPSKGSTLLSTHDADQLLQEGFTKLQAVLLKPNKATQQAAEALLQKSIENYQHINSCSPKLAFGLLCLGYNHALSGQLPKAKECLHHSLDLFRQLNQEADQALVELCLGNIGMQSGVVALVKKIKPGHTSNSPSVSTHSEKELIVAAQDAQALLEAAAQKFKHLENAIGEAMAFSFLRMAYLLTNQSQMMITAIQAAIDIYHKVGRPLDEALALMDLGGSFLILQQFERAEDTYQQARTRFKALGNSAGEALVLECLSILHVIRNDTRKMMDATEQARLLLRQKGLKLDDTLQVLKHESEASTVHSLIVQRYNQIFERSLEENNQTSPQPTYTPYVNDISGHGEMVNREGLGHRYLGDYQKAIDCFEEALSSCRERNYLEGEADALSNLGMMYYLVGQYKKAITYALDSLNVHNHLNWPFDKAKVLNNLGMAQASQSISLAWSTNKRPDFNESLASFEQSLDILRGANNLTAMGMTLCTLGGFQMIAQQYKTGIVHLNEALDLASQNNDTFIQAVALGNLGTASLIQEKPDQAIPYLQKAVDLVQQTNDQQGTAMIFGILGIAAFSAGDLETAEKSLRTSIKNWNTLRKRLREDSNKISFFETQVNDIYNTLQQVLVAQKRTDEALEISEKGRARAFVELLTQRLEYSTAKNQIEINNSSLSIEDIKNTAIRKNITIVQYTMAHRLAFDRGMYQKPISIFIWVIQPSGEIFFKDIKLNTKSKDKFNFINQISSLNLNTQYPQPLSTQESSCSGTLKQLYRTLIQPIEDYLHTAPEGKVVLIPHSKIFLVPFAALQDENGKYLIEKFDIVTLPSIQSLDLIENNKSQCSEDLLEAVVVGNPKMPFISLTEPPDELENLPWAEVEANVIAPLFDTQAITGEHATKDYVVQKMSKANLVHLATHSLIDDIRQLGTPGAIALAPSDNNDGFLSASEILNMQLNAPLVVLSACSTGRGKITGDGVIGLARSLLSAGACSVIVSLWTVSDLSTALMMIKFYQNIQSKMTTSMALRQAQLWLMRTTKAEVEIWMDENRDTIGNTLRQYLRRKLHTSSANQRLFSDPRYWSAFYTIGHL